MVGPAGAPDDGWKYHPKHVQQFPDINKLCNVASCWIYIGILLGAQYILHIRRIRVKDSDLEDVANVRNEFVWKCVRFILNIVTRKCHLSFALMPCVKATRFLLSFMFMVRSCPEF